MAAVLRWRSSPPNERVRLCGTDLKSQNEQKDPPPTRDQTVRPGHQPQSDSSCSLNNSFKEAGRHELENPNRCTYTGAVGEGARKAGKGERVGGAGAA